MVDIDANEILAWVLTEYNFGDSAAFSFLTELVFGAGHDISEVYVDAVYHCVENWKGMVGYDVAFVVRFLTSTIPKSHGCMARGRAATNDALCRTTNGSKGLDTGGDERSSAHSLTSNVS